MNCLLCGRNLTEGSRDELGSPSSGFLRFYTRGSEDSAVFTPDGRATDCEHLVVGICDDCMKDAGELGLVRHGELESLPGYPLPGQWNYTQWRYLRPLLLPVHPEDD